MTVLFLVSRKSWWSSAHVKVSGRDQTSPRLWHQSGNCRNLLPYCSRQVNNLINTLDISKQITLSMLFLLLAYLRSGCFTLCLQNCHHQWPNCSWSTQQPTVYKPWYSILHTRIEIIQISGVFRTLLPLSQGNPRFLKLIELSSLIPESKTQSWSDIRKLPKCLK